MTRVDADRVTQRTREVVLDHAAFFRRAAHVEERRADDDGSGAGLEQIFRAADRSHAAADAAGQPRRNLPHERVVGADAHRRVEIDELNGRELREAFDPAVEIARFDRELLTLHELNDAPFLKSIEGISIVT